MICMEKWNVTVEKEVHGGDVLSRGLLGCDVCNVAVNR
jgi:hypothetical protein